MATCEKLWQSKKAIFRHLILSLQLGLVFVLIACGGGNDIDVPDPHTPTVASTSVLDIPPSIIASPSGNTRIQQVGTDSKQAMTGLYSSYSLREALWR